MALDALTAILAVAQVLTGAVAACCAATRRERPALRGLWLLLAVVMLASGASTAIVGGSAGTPVSLPGQWLVLVVPALAAGAALLLAAQLVRTNWDGAPASASPGAEEDCSWDAATVAIGNPSASEGGHAVPADAVREMREAIETAVKISNITVALQDRDLRYRWIINSNFDAADAEIAGREDAELTTRAAAAALTEHKRRSLETGRPESFELELRNHRGDEWYRFDVSPVGGNGGATGVVTTAIDVTRAKRLDRMRTDLSKRLAETLQRLNLALKSGRILVFSQDLDLRYLWVNTTDSPIRVVVGKTDEELFPEPIAAEVVQLKRQVIETKTPSSGEFRLAGGEGDERFYDLHIEPNLSSTGEVVGLTCAAIDITHRVLNEQQMRLVMRELTHRTKNLLAVAIAIARQTAYQSSSVDAFVQALSARLRALATAQDLIVAGDWVGVDLEKLIRQQLEQLVRDSDRVALSGPPVTLSPEATQNFGLALHELAANAARYGALSRSEGTVQIAWDVVASDDGPLLKLDWSERGGPAVSPPVARGFGLNVVERNLARSLKADVDIRFEDPGFAMSISLPMKNIAAEEATRLQPTPRSR